jgi:polysaccharide export outer membrane protein
MGRLILILLVGVFTSCSSQRNLSYFADLPDDTDFKSAILKTHQAKIQEGDILNIVVSSLDPASNAMFNTGALQSSFVVANNEGGSHLSKEGYLVGHDGNINYPIIGKIQLKGLTLTEAHELMEGELIKYIKDPIVNVRYLNFKVTVIGEVQRPLTFTVANDRINILEALGMAGDMTVYGKRKNVLVIREEDGERNMVRLDFTRKETFNSPYFYLKQNDIVYVEPSHLKDPSGERTLRIISTVVTVVTGASLLIFRAF